LSENFSSEGHVPHFPKPYFREKRNNWYVQIRDHEHTLGPDKDAAFQKYHELMAAGEEPEQATSNLAVAILDAFLEWVQHHQEVRTYDFHKMHLTTFAKSLPRGMLVAQLKPFHVTQCMDAQTTWGANTKNGFCRSVCRAFNWAVKQGLIEKSPVNGVEKPPTERREDVVTPEEFEAFLALYPDQPFRDVLITAWDTGCRPQELTRVEARHVDHEGKRWIFTVKSSKGKRKPRIVYLTERSYEITKRLCQEQPTGKLFRNRDGEPWSKHTINRRFLRKKKRLGRKICLYIFRHSFATRLLLAGVDPMVVATLLGHANTNMLANHYSHLYKNPDHLRRALDAKGGAPALS
jgi:integrase